jgi:hypothetical protein
MAMEFPESKISFAAFAAEAASGRDEWKWAF